MREIKFRGFDKVGKEMFRVKMISFLEDGKFILSGKGGSITSEDCVIMQYTGLKDKNGKEIFEGDIIENDQWKTSRFNVVFNRGGFAITYPGDYLPKDIKYAEYFAVIGNIYENPELLDNQEGE